MKYEMNPKLAEICGIHVGDGYLRNDGKRKELDISGGIEEKGYYGNHVTPLFNDVFRLKLKGRFFPNRNTYGLVVRDAAIIELMNEIGFPYGAKSLKVRIPRPVFESRTLMKCFLRGYFDTDGSVCCIKRTKGKYTSFKKTFHYYPLINFSTASRNMLNDVQTILNKFGVNYRSYSYNSKKKTEHIRFDLVLYGPNKVMEFFRLMEPKNTSKTSRYDIWAKFGFCPSKTSFSQRQQILKGQLDILEFY